MKKNDYFALNLNLENTTIDPNNLRTYGITPDNTGLQEKDYYRTIPQVVNRFTTNEGFDENAFTEFYDSVKRSYSKFASDEYLRDILNSIPTSSTDIFSLGNTNIQDDSAYMIRSKDPNRHQIGIGNLFQQGKASFSEREVAQGNKVLDEKGNRLTWSPNDKRGLRALFRPTLALAEWEEGETSIENGIEVVHHKGERKYDENGDPMYQILGNKEIYGRDILHFSDTLTRDGTFWNKLDIFDSDGVETSIPKTIAKAVVTIGAYMSPAGPYLGALEVAKELAQTLPAITKAVNSAITNNNNNEWGKTATSLENWASRFDRSTSDQGSASFWTFENIANQLIDSTKQLYSQNLIQKIPKLLNAHPSIKSQKIGQLASILYMATTSAEDVYGAYKQAGVNDRYAGLGALATMAAFFGFMNNNYFKTYLFNDPTLELPELRRMLKSHSKAMANIYKKQVNKIAEEEGVKITEENVKRIALSEGTKWYNKVYNSVATLINKIPEGALTDNAYLVRGFNEGLEEVMEEGATDLVKGLTLGLDSLGFDVRQDDANDIDFGYSLEDFLERYATSFVGGMMGGVVFEGLNQWNTRKVKSVSKLDLDEQFAWYIRNGYRSEIEKTIDLWKKKKKFASDNLSMYYQIDPDKKTITWDPSSDKKQSQNDAIADLLKQQVAVVDAELKSIGLVDSDNKILQKAISNIKEEAKKAGMDVEKYMEKNLRDPYVEFIKQTGVHKLILTEVADVQHQIMLLNRRIENYRNKLLNVPDTQKEEAEKALKDDVTLKIYESDLKKAKEKLSDILDGKRANEFLRLGLFAGDEELKRIYLSDTSDEKAKPTYFESLDGWVRTKYNQEYSEIQKTSGPKDENTGLTDIEEYLKSGFLAWRSAKEDINKLRGAFDLHLTLSQQIEPIIKQQIEDWSGYKAEDGRYLGIRYGSENAVALYTEAVRLKQELDKYKEENPDSTEENDEEFSKLKKEFDRIIAEQYYLTPQRVLDQLGVDSEGNPINIAENVKRADGIFENADALLTFIKDYYTKLNADKIVSEFSEDVLEVGINNLANNLKRTGLRNFRDLLRSAKSDINVETAIWIDHIKDKLQDEIDNFGQDPAILEELNEIEELLKNNIENDSLGEDFLIDRLFDEYGDMLEDEYVNNYPKLRDQYILLKAIDDNNIQQLIDDVYNSFEKNPLNGISSYTNLIEKLKSISNIETLFPNLEAVIDSLLFDKSNFINRLQQILEIKSQGIKTPIMDWINAFSLNQTGESSQLWTILQSQIKGLKSMDDLSQFEIDNPKARRELQFLINAIRASYGVLRGALPLGANFFINQLKVEGVPDLPVLEIQELADVYANDLEVIGQRVGALLDLHEKNHKSTITIKKETYVKNAPKFLDRIVGQVTGEETLLQQNFRQLLGVDLVKLWNDIAGDKYDITDISEEEFDAFWKDFRKWMDAVHKAIKEINVTETIQKVNEKTGRSLSSINEAISYALVSPYSSNLWKFINSEITNDDDEKVQDLDVVLTLAAIIGYDPSKTFSGIQYVSEQTGKKPFWDQTLAILIGFSQTRSRNLFENIVNEIAASGEVQVDNNPEIEDIYKEYLKNRSKISHAVYVDGASGTGKSTIVLRFIKTMNDVLEFKEDGTKYTVKSLAVAKYKNRTNALGDILNLTGENRMVFDELVKKYFRPLTKDDYLYKSNGERGYDCIKLKPEVIKEIQETLAKNKVGLNDNEILNIYVDEVGLMSEADIQFLSILSDSGLINLVLAGDRMQKGFTSENNSGVPINSGVPDVQMLSTPRLTTSIRSENFGMQYNLSEMEARLKVLWQKFQEAPWTEGTKLTFDTPMLFKPIFTKTKYGLYGIGITSNGENAVETVKQYGKTVGIITDHPDDYSKYASSTINVVDPDTVQGNEYDYVIIDISKFPNVSEFDALRYEYTLLSRARNGVLIVNSLGSVSTYEERADAASEINERDENGELVGDEIEAYKQWWNSLYSEDVFQGATSPQGTQTKGQGNGGNNSGGTQTGPSNLGRNVANLVTFNFEGFNEDDFKEQVKQLGDQVSIPFYTKTEQRKSDLRHYKEWHEIADGQSNTGKLINTKAFIDALMKDNVLDDLLIGKHSILNGLNYTADQFIEYKKFIRNFMLDFLQLNVDEFKQKYSDKGSIDIQLKSVIGGSVEWNNFINSLYKTVSEWGKTVYAVNINGRRYFYYIVKQTSNVSSAVQYFAFPILIVDGFSANEGWLNLDVSQSVPMVMLSSAGFITRPLEETAGNYVEVSRQGYIPKTDTKTENLTPQVKQFINNTRGTAHKIITSIFNNSKAKPEVLLTRRLNGEVIEHIDQTTLDGNERISAVNRRFTVAKYVELAKILRKLWNSRNPLSPEETQALQEYVESTIFASITSTTDDVERVKQFKKIQLTSPSVASDLVTALMRWYYNKGGEELNTFINNFLDWITYKDGSLNKNLQAIQRGISLSIVNNSFLTDTYYIIPSSTDTFDVWISRGYGEAEKIGTVSNSDVLNLDPKSFNVEQLAKNLINAINGFENRLNSYSSLEEDIKKGIVSGEISVGLTAMYTNHDQSRETSIRFYPPFDSNIVSLITDNAVLDPKFEEFLQKDSKFKYGFLVGFTGTNTNFQNEDWMVCTPTGATSDIIEILPPLFSIDTESRPTSSLGLPSSLGTLDHAIESDDKTKVTVNAYKNRDGNVYKYDFETKYTILKSELEGLVNGSIADPSSKFVIQGIENGKITYSANGKTYESNITPNKVLELLDQMNVNVIDSGTISKDVSGNYYLINENNNYFIENKAGDSSVGIIVDYDGNELIALYNGEFLHFTNVSQQTFSELHWKNKKTLPESKFIGNVGNELYYYDANNDKITISTDFGDLRNLKIVSITEDSDNLIVLLDGLSGRVSKIIPKNSQLFKFFNDKNNKIPSAQPEIDDNNPTVKAAKNQFKKLKQEDFLDPLLQSDPNAWAKQRAVKLNGWYVFKNNKFVQTNETLLIYQFAQYIVKDIDDSLDIQSIINNSDSIQVDQDIINWKVSDDKSVQFKFSKSGSRGNVQFNFEPITSDAVQLWKAFDAFLQTIPDEELRNIIYAIEYCVVNPNLNTIANEGYEILATKYIGNSFVKEYYDKFNGRLDENYCPIL